MNKDVWFEMILHRPTFTAQADGRAMHVPCTEVAKGLLMKADQYVLAVVPAYAHVDFVAIREALDVERPQVAAIARVHEPAEAGRL
jgi:prolyl-tRNA editing enzyme YbaK/EbsC (Cys-tRNA(Pro) deacylase)